MIELPAAFLRIMKDKLGDGFARFLASYDRRPYRAIRVNTLKVSVERFADISPFELQPVPWTDCGFYVDGDRAGKSIAHAAGLYYVQEPSAMSAAPLLDAQPCERVLDMCSAPGGKGTQLAQSMRGRGVIFMNEIDPSRAKILSQNVERLGIENAVVTSAGPETVADKYEGYFDKVLVDAPCSGEGMFLKEENAVRGWSERSVEACALRQANILESAQRALRSGGLMVYSTCTFSEAEDEGQIAAFLTRHPEFELIEMKKLMPHECRGEGHFVALMRKGGGSESPKVRKFKPVADGKSVELYRRFESAHLKRSFDNLCVAGDTLYSLPEDCPELLPVTLRSGVRLGEIKGGRFEPAHALAMCLNADSAPCIDVDEATALGYLRGLTFECPEYVSGWRVVTYLGYALGWCKCVGGVAKNHLPKGLRI